MDTRSIGIDINGLSRRIRRYLGATMPARTRIATGGNAHIIMFLARHRGQVIVQRDIERRFCITRSTASRVLALMERKGLIVREPVPGDARMKRIGLTASADAIVEDLVRNAVRMDEELLAGFSPEDRLALSDYMMRLMTNIDAARSRRERAGADASEALDGGVAAGGQVRTPIVGPDDPRALESDAGLESDVGPVPDADVALAGSRPSRMPQGRSSDQRSSDQKERDE